MAFPTFDQTQPISGPSPQAAQGQTLPSIDQTEPVENYQTLPEQALNVVEHVGKGLVGPVVPAVEKGLTALGVPNLTPEAQSAREVAGPGLSKVSEVGGLITGSLADFGVSAGLEGLGNVATDLAGLAAPASLTAKVGGGLLRGAVEGAAFQAQDEASKAINDPNIAASSVAANIGLGALLGGGAGAILGPISPLWRTANEDAVAKGIGDFTNTMDGAVSDQAAQAPLDDISSAGTGKYLGKMKTNAPELMDIAETRGWATPEGMLSDNKLIRQGEDALLNGPPTLPSISRQKLYNDAYNNVATDVDRAVSVGSSDMSETQAGNAIKQSLGQKLEAAQSKISDAYDDLGVNRQEVPVSLPAIKPIQRSLNTELEKLVPGTDRYNFLKSMVDRMPWVDDLQKLADLRTEVWKAGKRDYPDLAHTVSNALDGMEERSIDRWAAKSTDPTLANGLKDQISSAKGIYKDYMETMNPVAKALGKSKIKGPQDFIDFVENMNPQALSRKLFNENNTELTSYFAEKFPEEFNIIRGYERGNIRQSAMDSGVFKPQKAIKAISGMEPETKKLLFSNEELSTISDAKKWMQNLPEKFNPGGTNHESAFRSFFESPTGAAIANLRDYGIQAFVKTFGKAANVSEKEAGQILPLLGKSVMDKDVNPGAFKHSVEYATAAVRGENLMSRAAKSLFSTLPVAATTLPDKEKTDKLNKSLQSFNQNPDLYARVGGEMGHYLPNHDIAIKSIASTAASYLNSIRPQPQKLGPLDAEIQPNDAQNENFQQALDIAEKPLSIVSLMKQGTFTAQHAAHLNAMYPDVANQFGQKIFNEMINSVSKGDEIPYNVKFGLSTLMGQPLDSVFKPQSIAANQATFMQVAQEDAAKSQPQSKRSSTSQVGMREMKPADRVSLSRTTDES